MGMGTPRSTRKSGCISCPQEHTARICAGVLTSAEHLAICYHPLWAVLESSIENSQLDPILFDLLSNENAKDQLVGSVDEEEDAAVKRLKGQLSLRKEKRVLEATARRSKPPPKS